ncbi:MAG: aspartate aminotransferase family protein [Alphaproteobacteria bacterium]|nr:aspartate aminotransferase family protein [Alphaproteobacteria bacterium]
MTTTSLSPVPALAHSQTDYYEIAERTLPGAGLGGYSLPEEVRFVIERGEGSRVQSVDGRWYIDYVGGAGANILGHAHPAVTAAVQAQVANGIHFFGTLSNIAITLSEKLVATIPCAEKIAFTTTGSEATAYALRLARAYTGRDMVLKFEGAYHGNHDYASFSQFPKSAANYPQATASSGGVPSALQDTMLVAPYNDLDVVEGIAKTHKDDLAAIIVEPIQRIIFPEPGFLEGLRRIADENRILLIFDEVVTGFRLALGGAQEHFGVQPDLAAYGKIVGGGGPLGCVAGPAEILDHTSPRNMDKPDYAYINGTLHGNPVAAAAGLATIEELERPGLHKDLADKTERYKTALQEVLNRHRVPALVAGSNSFWQILFMERPPANQIDILNSDRARMVALDTELLRRGIYVLPGVRRFLAVVNTDEDLAETVSALDESCAAIA